MIEQNAAVNLSYLIEIGQTPEASARALESISRYLVENRCVYGDKAMPTLLKPVFVTPSQSKIITYVVETLTSALNKFIRAYLKTPEIQVILDFSEAENTLFAVDPGFAGALVVARLDAFMNDYTVKFLEFNCDSPAGAAYADILDAGFSRHLETMDLSDDWRFEFIFRQKILLDALLECYAEFRQNRPGFPERPTIAIVDWAEVATSAEFYILQNYFEQNGYKTIITSPQQFEIKNGKLFAEGTAVDLINRRVITRELLERQDEVGDFMQGIKDGLVCVCNPFRSYIVGNKKILAVMTDPRFQDFYTPEEKRVIRQTIPWTKVLADTSATFHDYTVNLKQFVADNKNKLVLKPANSYGGKDVFLGRETEQSEWEKVIAANIGSADWVVQEYVDIPEEMFPVFGEQMNLKLKKVNLNPFAFNGRYSGTISRISDASVINVTQGGGMAPTLTFEALKKDII